MTRRDPALRSHIASAANAFRFQADVDAVRRAPRSFEAARRKLARAEEEVRRSDVSDGEELLNFSYEAIHAAAQGLAYALGYTPGRDSDLGHSAVFSFGRAVCSKLAPELDGPLDRVNAIIRPLRHKALYDHVYPTREQGRDAYDLAAHLVPALAGVAGTAER